jgi:hypothetical protein
MLLLQLEVVRKLAKKDYQTGSADKDRLLIVAASESTLATHTRLINIPNISKHIFWN